MPKLFLSCTILLFTQTAIANSALLGTWLSECQRFGEYYLMAQVDFNRTQNSEFGLLSALGILYEDTLCQKPIARYTYAGDFKHTDKSSDGTLTHIPFGVTLNPLSERGAKILNTARFCSFRNWQAGKIKYIVRKRNCGAFQPPRAADRTYNDIFVIKSNHLYFGGFPFQFSRRKPKQLNDNWSFKLTQ